MVGFPRATPAGWSFVWLFSKIPPKNPIIILGFRGDKELPSGFGEFCFANPGLHGFWQVVGSRKTRGNWG